jgi:catechol 2,3-dioxygenase-like lactoylglutathione lyase family enzyme
MRRIHHVNLGVPPDLVDAEAEFLVGVLGYRVAELPPEAERFGALWFDADDGTQVHLSRDPEHAPARQAHTALVVGDELDAIQERLDDAGSRYKAAEGMGNRVLLCRDPAGNRWELRSA